MENLTEQIVEKFQEEKPIAHVIGEDGNVFNTLGICSRALKSVGLNSEAREMSSRVMSSGSYDEALQIMMEYCDFQ